MVGTDAAPLPPPPEMFTVPMNAGPVKPEPPEFTVKLPTVVGVNSGEKLAPVPEPTRLIVGVAVKFVPPEVTVTLAIGPVQAPDVVSVFEAVGLSKPSQLWQ